MTQNAIDAWYRHAIGGEERAMDIPTLLREEVPPLLSWIVRGGCAVQCEHCIFPFEGPKARLELPSTETMISLLQQLTGEPTLVHEGRQLLPAQVPVLAAIKRAGFRVSLINNGQYATPAMLALCEQEGLEIDALDVSVDGPPRIHNAQRVSFQAYAWAMEGLNNARRVLGPNGKVTSLFTLTSRNHSYVQETADTVMPLVDEWHVTTMSLRPGIEHMRADKRGLANALEQLIGLRREKSVALRTYSLQDFVEVLEILGEKSAREALAGAVVTYNAIMLDVGVPFYFYPKSLQVNETLAVDADGWWRLPFCIHHSLDELQNGVSAEGQDLSHFSVTAVSEKLDVSKQYAEAVATWWRAIGRACLNDERVAVQRLLNGIRSD